MKSEIRLTVDIENPAEVKAAIEMLQKFTSATVEKKEVAKKETAKKAEATPPVEKIETIAAASSAIKIEDVRAMLAKKVDAHRAEIKAQLTVLNVGNVTSLLPSDYISFLDFLTAL